MKSPFLKLLVLVVCIAVVTYFIEQSFPSIFITLRVIAFFILVFAFIRFFNKK